MRSVYTPRAITPVICVSRLPASVLSDVVSACRDVKLLSSCRTQSTQLRTMLRNFNPPNQPNIDGKSRSKLRHISHKRTTTGSVSDRLYAGYTTSSNHVHPKNNDPSTAQIHISLDSLPICQMTRTSLSCIHVFMIDTWAPSFNPTTIHLFIRTCNLKTVVHRAN
jgi:hypothetical protein